MFTPTFVRYDSLIGEIYQEMFDTYFGINVHFEISFVFNPYGNRFGSRQSNLIFIVDIRIFLDIPLWKPDECSKVFFHWPCRG